MFALPAAATPLSVAQDGMVIFKADGESEAIMLRSGVAEGVALRTNVIAALTGAPVYNVWVRYTERA
jgi:hypothetical protein